MALGSLVVSLGLDAADFITGLSKSEQQAKNFGQNVDRAIAAGIIKAEIALQAFTRGIGTAVAAFKDLTTGAGEFQDLSETTGAAAESIASLAVSAAVAGVSIGDVAGATQKLTKNLVGVDDESKAAGAALTALNLNVDEFKKLDPVGQYEAVGKALAGFADGAGKTAVAQALFGKSGAEQLKVFKALEEAGGRQTILTAQQIKLADDYGDAQAKSRAQLRLYAQAAATEAIPALTDLTTALTGVIKELLGVDQAGKQVSGSNAVKAFADDAADALAFVADAGLAAVRIISLASSTIKALAGDALLVAAVTKAVKVPTPDSLQGIKDAFETRQKWAEEASQKLSDLLDKDAAKFRNALGLARDARTASINASLGQNPAELARRGRPVATRPDINFNGPDKAAKDTKDATTAADRYLRSLEDQLNKTQELTAVELVLDDIRTGKAGKLGIVQQEVLKNIAGEIDATKEAIRVARERADARNKDNDAAEQAARDNERAERDRLKALTAGTTSEVTRRQQQDIEYLRQAYYDAKISVEDYGEAVRIVMGQTAKEVEKTDDIAKELGLTFSSAFEDAIVEGKKLSDVLKALEKDILRIFARKLVTEPLAGGITDLLKGSGGGGLGDLIGGGLNFLFGGGGGGVPVNGTGANYFGAGGILGGGRASGGPTEPNTAYRFRENGPEVYSDGSGAWLFTGNRRGMVDPSPRVSAGGGRTVSVTNNFHITGPVSRETQQQMAARAGRAVGAAAQRMN